MNKNNSIKVHLGSSNYIIKGWLNYDIDPKGGAIKADLTKGIPHKDNSVSKIFSEHVIEHFSKQEGYNLLKDCYRILKPGGTMRIGWPNLNKIISSHLLKSKKHYNHGTPHLDLRYGHWDEITSDRLFSWGHKYAYTPRYMKDILTEIGFKEIKKCKYMDSSHGYKYDTHNDPVTIYMEATK